MNNDNVRNQVGGKFRRLALTVIVIAMVLLPALLTTRPAAAQLTPIVRCDPLGTIQGQVGQQFFVDLYIQNVTNLYGVQLRIDFDPTIVQAVDQDLIFPGVQILPLFGFLVPGFIVERDADNTLGIVEYSMTQLDPQPPANGSGGVARIVFTGVQDGLFTMEWDDTYVLLSAPAGVPIPSTTQDCVVQVGTPTAVALSGVGASPHGSWAGGVAAIMLMVLGLTTAVVWIRVSRRAARRPSA